MKRLFLSGLFLVVVLVVSGCSESADLSKKTTEIDTEVNKSLDSVVDNSTNLTSEDLDNQTNSIGACSDSDAGKEYDKWGYIKVNNTKTYQDSCTSNQYLKEFYCKTSNTGDFGIEIHTCTFECVDGVCIDPPETNTTNTTNST